MIGAAAALAAGPGLASTAGAETPAVPVAATYAELLQPIPNAVERLKASDAEAASRPPRLIEAQFVRHHHHHHHHHGRRWYLANGYYWYGGAWVLRHHHHHHHHHHNHY
jgi:hypothetical protein